MIRVFFYADYLDLLRIKFRCQYSFSDTNSNTAYIDFKIDLYNTNNTYTITKNNASSSPNYLFRIPAAIIKDSTYNADYLTGMYGEIIIYNNGTNLYIDNQIVLHKSRTSFSCIRDNILPNSTIDPTSNIGHNFFKYPYNNFVAGSYQVNLYVTSPNSANLTFVVDYLSVEVL
jgi:hypothetical protein